MVKKANLVVGNNPSSAANTFVLKSPSFSLIELYSIDVPISKPGKNLNPIFDVRVSLLPFQKPPFENVFQAETFLYYELIIGVCTNINNISIYNFKTFI